MGHKTAKPQPELTEREATIRLHQIYGHLLPLSLLDNPNPTPTAVASAKAHDAIRERIDRLVARRRREGASAVEILVEVEALVRVERNYFGRTWAQVIGLKP